MSNYIIFIRLRDQMYRDEATILLFETQFSETAYKAVEDINKFMEDYKQAEDTLYREENEKNVDPSIRKGALEIAKEVISLQYPISAGKLDRMTYYEWAGWKVDKELVEEYVI